MSIPTPNATGALVTLASGIFGKYAAILLPGIVTLLGTVQALRADGVVTDDEGGQLIAVVAGLTITYFVPLLRGRIAGLLKTGAAVLAAVATLVIPTFFGSGLTVDTFIVFVLAALNALATQVGVSIRVDTIDARESTGVPVVTSLPSTVVTDDFSIDSGPEHRSDD